MKKRLLSAILSFCMLLTMAPTVAFAAEDDEAAPQSSSVLEGSCGAKGSEGNVQWALTDDDGDGSYYPDHLRFWRYGRLHFADQAGRYGC